MRPLAAPAAREIAARREAWRAARRVLCVRLDGMGDVLMTTPAIAALRAEGRRVTLLASPAGAAIGALVPDVDEVIACEAPWMKATPPRPLARHGIRSVCTPGGEPPGAGAAERGGGGEPAGAGARAPGAEGAAVDLAMVRRLAEGGFDAAVVFTVYSQSALPAALLCLLADIPLRLAHSREKPYQLLTDWLPDPEPAQVVRHEARRQLDLVASVGCTVEDERLRLRVPPAAREAVRALLAERGVAPGRWLLVHPGASAPSRRYPPALLVEAARALVLVTGWTIVLAGAASDRELAEQIRMEIGPSAVSVAGELDLAGLAALIEAAPVMIGNNSGPMHVAAAVGTRVVDLYALTNPQHTPWSVESRVLSCDVPCKYCYSSVCLEGHHGCLRGVSAEQVVEATLSLLAG